MQVTAYCAAKSASIDPTSFSFLYKDYDVVIHSLKSGDENELMLKISNKISDDQLKEFRNINNKNIRDDFEKRLRPYKELLTEIAHLMEGIFSVKYQSIPPRFNTDVISVTLHADTEDEQRQLDSGEIRQGLGNAQMYSSKPAYEINSHVLDCIKPASNHLPALSFFSQAVRSFSKSDNEVAFFLFFRIIDGYFSEGASDVEKALHRKETELVKYLSYSPEIIDSCSKILDNMGLQSKGSNNYLGLISDIVLIRHKLTHFSATNAIRHHSPKIKFELGVLNDYLYRGTHLLLFEKIH